VSFLSALRWIVTFALGIFASSFNGLGYKLFFGFLAAVAGVPLLWDAYKRRRAHGALSYTPMSDEEVRVGLEAADTVGRMQERWMEFDGECEALAKRIALVAPGQERTRLTSALERAERNRAKAWAWLNEG
jgi:hypothetical protein